MMVSEKCADCPMKSACRETRTAWIFFFIGISATVAIRVIEPLRTIDPFYGKVSWYAGVAGFFMFFAYKYRELRARSKIIREYGLKKKLSEEAALSKGEYSLLSSIVCSQDNWKERMNFFVIFSLSAIVLAVALWLDFSGG